MAKEKTLYSCTECGDTSPKWLGKCPGCGAWNTLIESAPASSGQNRYSQRVSLAPASAVATAWRTVSTLADAEVPERICSKATLRGASTGGGVRGEDVMVTDGVAHILPGISVNRHAHQQGWTLVR